MGIIPEKEILNIVSRYLLTVLLVTGFWSTKKIGISSSTVYLDKRQVNLPVNIDRSSSFSFSFLACSEGTILQQGNDLKVSIQSPKDNSTFHSILVITWRTATLLEQTITLKPSYSLETNIFVKLKVEVNATGLLVHITPDLIQTQGQNLTVIEKFTKGDFRIATRDNSSLVLGSFSGCIFNGNQVVVDSVSNECPLDSWAPCPNAACPSGFGGRFCQYNINACLNETLCLNEGKCRDEFDGYTCICGERYTGKRCQTYLGPICNNTICLNGGICKNVDNGNDFSCICKDDFTGRYCESKHLPCNGSPCQNNGSCTNDPTKLNGYVCSCPKGFTGVRCEKNVNDCFSGACGYHGVCVDGVNTFTCQCNQGFEGDRCQTNIDECQDVTICNNGTCKDRDGTYTCTCHPGYTGRNCEYEIDECVTLKPCLNGTCLDKLNDYKCDCAPGSEGKDCDQEVDECKLGYCKNHVNCIDKFNDYECICKNGYMNKNCTGDVNECNQTTGNPCFNGGECINNIGGFTCICNSGFTGSNCSGNIDDCTSNPCGVNGRCQDGVANYTCICDIGFTGRNCQTNIDDCAGVNPCQHNGKCIDGVNNYTCNCITSWTGRNCTIEQDPCALHSPCENNATCERDPAVGYICNCTTNYGSKNCDQRIGLCYPSDPCHNGTCVYTQDFNNYTCVCHSGFQGRNCSEDIKECTTIKDLCTSLDKKAKCVEKEGSYQCKCSPEYEGVNCTMDVNECAINKNYCHGNGECENLVGTSPGARCKCNPGWVGSNCEYQFFPCTTYELQNKEKYCKNGGQCIDEGNNPICNCTDTGFTDERCDVDINECLAIPCKNGGKCNNLVNDYNCTCPPGYSGKSCEEDIDECQPRPCMFGRCHNLINAYKCECYQGYDGDNCDNDINYCANVTCEYGGECIDGNTTFTCQCLPGYNGTHCEEDIKDCELNPCQFIDADKNIIPNICVERSNLTAMKEHNFPVNASNFLNRDGYECVCTTGLTGKNCNDNSPDCNHTFCRNNSTCVDLVNDYRCKCVPGFEGKNCSTDIDECQPKPCLNNGNCTNLLNDYSCTCHANYTGRNCEMLLNYCTVYSPCKNNGICKPTSNNYTCDCQNGYTGRTCLQSTTGNFNGSSQWLLPVQSKPVQVFYFRFRTVLPGSLLILKNLSATFFVYLDDRGRIQLTNTKTFTTSSSYADGKWHSVKLTFTADDTRVSYDNYTAVSFRFYDTFRMTNIISARLGEPFREIPAFTGCIQDFTVNGESFTPSSHGTTRDVKIGPCIREDQCSKCTEKKNRVCVDLWTTHTCKCLRQYYGDNCDQEIKAFSFQKLPNTNSTRRRRATADNRYVSSNINSDFNSTHGFSFRIRTRQTNGFIALLLSEKPVKKDENYGNIVIESHEGSIRVTHNFTKMVYQSLETISDGKWKTVEVFSDRLVIDGLSGPKITNIGQSIRFVFLGGVDDPDLYSKVINKPIFDGCLQAIEFGTTVLTNQQIPKAPTASVTSSSDVKEGCTGAKVCFNDTCHYGGKCNDEWNLFTCDCQPGYYEKRCSVFGCKHNNTCLPKENCIDLPLSQPPVTRCSQALTYNGVNSSTVVTSSSSVTKTSLTFTLRTRQASAHLLSTTGYNFNISINDGFLVFQRSDGNNVVEVNDTLVINDGVEHLVFVNVSSGITTLYVDNIKRVEQNVDLLNNAWISSLSKPVTISNGEAGLPYFQGCLKGLHFGDVKIDLSSANNTDVINGCQSSIDPCMKSPCKNGGGCNDNFNDFKCVCSKYWAGKTCEETKDLDCNFNGDTICNNGTCVPAVAGGPILSKQGKDYFTCTCASGYTGALCDTEINECDSNPCQHGGNCTDQLRGYKCTCVNGITGVNCETNINDCDPSPCKFNRSCKDLIGDYSCDCGGVFTGKNCQDDINECLNSTICNNGTCSNSDGNYSCKCDQGFFGGNCEYNNTQLCSIRKPCFNSGVCRNDMSGYNCTCVNGYRGVNCRISDPPVEDDDNLALILGLSIAAFVIILLVLCILVRYCRDKSGMEGTYSPNKEEQAGANVEMNVIKKPKTERLI